MARCGGLFFIMANKNLTAAKNAKNDEFYTQLTDIEKELMHYRDHFKDKIVFCNCDDPTYSNFWKYFHLNFERLGLRKLIATHFDAEKPTYKLEYVGGNDGDVEAGVVTELMQNGDFRSPECIELLQEADIVVTNPPFSLFREYVAQLMEYGKKFVIIGNMNAITYKEFFPLLKENKVWSGFGFNKTMELAVPDHYDTSKSVGVDEQGRQKVKVPAICWYTNLDIKKRHEPIDLVEKYSPEKYPKYDNYDAIEVSKTLDIPMDYDGVMGVPISFLDKYCPEQFEIVGLAPERLPENESSLRIKVYRNAIQHKKDGSTCSGNKVNDGPTILHFSLPKKYPYYTSETVEGYFLEVLYARVLIRRK